MGLVVDEAVTRLFHIGSPDVFQSRNISAFAIYDYIGHIDGVIKMREIQLRDAKATLSAVVDEAMQGRPAVITRHGKRQAVVVSYEQWERLSHVPSFGRLLMAAPLTADDLPGRNASGPRTTDL